MTRVTRTDIQAAPSAMDAGPTMTEKVRHQGVPGLFNGRSMRIQCEPGRSEHRLRCGRGDILTRNVPVPAQAEAEASKPSDLGGPSPSTLGGHQPSEDCSVDSVVLADQGLGGPIRPYFPVIGSFLWFSGGFFRRDGTSAIKENANPRTARDDVAITTKRCAVAVSTNVIKGPAA